MIQYWGTNGEWGIDGLTIANNIFLETDGGWTQSIFGHVAGGNASNVRFRDFEISDNLIVNNHLHGISLGNVTDSEIHHNLLLPGPGWATSNNTGGLPKIFLPDDQPASVRNSVHSNIVVAANWQNVPEDYFGTAFATNDIGANTYLRDEGGSPFFLDVFPGLHDDTDQIPDLTVARPGALATGHGPRWLARGEPLEFADIYDTVFLNDIIWMADQGITSGCSVSSFCPEDPVTRGQMAAFFTRAFDLPAASPAGFSDTGASVFGSDIDKFAAAGITQGCGGDRFCPDEPVTRGQMAAFFARALALAAGTDSGFNDTSASVFAADIDRLAAANITQGCTSDRYCPEDPITRGQMAAFFRRASQHPNWPAS
jgi:hypothetical protein